LNAQQEAVPENVPLKSGAQGKKGKLLDPIHNHLETESCTASCPNYRAKLVKDIYGKLDDIEADSF